MSEIILAWLNNYGITIASVTILTTIIGIILKKIPTDDFAIWAKKKGISQGIAMTKFFNSKLPKLWNGIIEPVFIDTLNAIGISWIGGLIEGLKTDKQD